MNQGLTGDLEITRAQNRNYAVGEGFHRMAKNAASCSLFLRYQAQAERHYRPAVEEFERLKALRHKLPNEAILDVQPDKTTSAPLPTNPNLLGTAPLAPSSAAGTAPAQPALSARAFDEQLEISAPASPDVERFAATKTETDPLPDD